MVNFARIKSQNYKHAKSSGFSEKIARQVAFAPHIEYWCIFIRRKMLSHGWNVWQKNLKIALKAGNIFGSEQIAMNMSIYHDEIRN